MKKILIFLALLAAAYSGGQILFPEKMAALKRAVWPFGDSTGVKKSAQHAVDMQDESDPGIFPRTVLDINSKKAKEIQSSVREMMDNLNEEQEAQRAKEQEKTDFYKHMAAEPSNNLKAKLKSDPMENIRKFSEQHERNK